MGMIRKFIKVLYMHMRHNETVRNGFADFVKDYDIDEEAANLIVANPKKLASSRLIDYLQTGEIPKSEHLNTC